MIVVTRLNGSQFALNPDLVERIHAAPDTTLVMVDGAQYIVTESMAEVIDMIALYRARVIALASELPSAALRRGLRPLGLVGTRENEREGQGGDPVVSHLRAD